MNLSQLQESIRKREVKPPVKLVKREKSNYDEFDLIVEEDPDRLTRPLKWLNPFD